jgi:hypothetical protein
LGQVSDDVKVFHHDGVWFVVDEHIAPISMSPAR